MATAYALITKTIPKWQWKARARCSLRQGTTLWTDDRFAESGEAL